MAGVEHQGTTAWQGRLAWIVSVLLVVAIIIYLLGESFQRTGDWRAFLHWFDPYFFAYNLILTLSGILIVPSIVYFYTRQMGPEKWRRLRRDMEDLEPNERKRREIEAWPLVEAKFRLRSYRGSLTAATTVIILGIVMLLLMKPCFPEGPGPEICSTNEARGVNFGRGANTLILGSEALRYPSIVGEGEAAEIIYEETEREQVYQRIVTSLVAFQFGFLGAFVYFISSLVRSYFTLDLSAHTLVDGTIRMVIASILALVLCFLLPSLLGDDQNMLFPRALPVLAFFLGYFPAQAIRWIQLWGNQLLGLGLSKYNETPLTILRGMSSYQSMPLQREGFDNIENLAQADPLDLAVRTGLGYRQLRAWVGESRLRTRLGQDFAEFAASTWIRTEEDLARFFHDWIGPRQEAIEHLAAICPTLSVAQVRTLERLVMPGRAESSAGPATS